jgi:hypothetical protein
MSCNPDCLLGGAFAPVYAASVRISVILGAWLSAMAGLLPFSNRPKRPAFRICPDTQSGFKPSALGLLFLAAVPVAHAQGINLDDSLGSDLLPAGRHAVRLETRMGLADSRYNSDGEELPLFNSFNNVPLLSLGIPSAQVTQFESSVSGQRLRFTYGYGFHDDLTAGIVFGWYQLRNKVNLGLSPGLATVQNVQTVLTGAPLGYKPIASSRTESPLDTNIGLRWRAAKGDDWSVVISPVLRLGTAKQDDPDDLTDLILDDGSTDFQISAELYRQWRDGWETRSALQYTYSFEDSYRARAIATGESLVAQTRTEDLDRQLGQAVSASLDVARRMGDWRFSGTVEYAYNAATDFHSNRGQNVSGLEWGTSGWTIKSWLGVSWSGVKRYLAEGKGFPAIISANYETVVKASNAVKTQNLHVSLTVPF